MSWQPIEQMVSENPIWVLKYNVYFANGQFCSKDHPDAVKFTDCHGWYENEADAMKVLRHFPKPDGYCIEKVFQRKLIEEPDAD